MSTFHSHLNSLLYVDFLQSEITNNIIEIAEEAKILFQHTICPAHNGTEVIEYLNCTFSNT